MGFDYRLIADVTELAELCAPVLAGKVPELAIDTETTEVLDGYFTPLGTDLRMAGFSLSWPGVDLYVPVRHAPYDWRRRVDLIQGDHKHNGAYWAEQLVNVEGVMPMHEDGLPRGAWQPNADPNVPLGDALEVLQQVLACGALAYMHNATFDAKILARDGMELLWDRIECTQAMSVLTDPRPLDVWDEDAKAFLHGGHGLKHLGEVWLDIPADAQAKLKEAQQALGKGGAMLWDYSVLPLRSAVAPYAAMDTKLTYDLAQHIKQRDAYADPKIRALIDLHRAERELIVAMETRGIPVDKGLAATRADEVRTKVGLCLSALKAQSGGRTVPVDSPTKLAPFLYGELGIPRYRGQDNTRDATLKQVRTEIVSKGLTRCGPILADDAVKLLDSIMQYRKVTKELSSFYEPLSKGTDIIHPTLRPLAARTTRMAAEKPNAHQMKKPRKGDDPTLSVRHLFKPPDGQGFLAADYSAQEMRISAHYTAAIPASFPYRFTWRCTLQRRGDCKGRGKHGPGEVHVGYRDNYSVKPEHLHLFEGFWQEGTAFDPHQRMVEYIAKEGIPGIDRGKGKTADFAILYGSGGPNLAATLNCDVKTAYRLIRMFWDDVYPELGRVKQFIDERFRRVGPESKWSHCEYITTMHGGRVFLDDGYKGLNYLIQRSAREMLAKALVGVDDYLGSVGARDTYLLRLPVHDELIFTVPKDSLDEEVVRGISRVMVDAGCASKVPMVVEPKWATESWAIKESLPDTWGWDGVKAAQTEDE